MVHNNNEYGTNLTISEIIYVIKRRFVMILLFALLFSVGGYFYSTMTNQPTYYATSSLVINPTSTADVNSAVDINSLVFAKTLVPTYTQILRSNKVMDYVLSELNLSIPKDRLKSYVSLSAVDDTQIIDMTVTCHDAKLAIDISNAIIEAAPKALMATFQIGTVHVLDSAIISKVVVHDVTRDTAGAGLLGIGVGFILSLISQLLSIKVRNVMDVKAALGLPVFGEIEHVRRKKAKQGLLLSSSIVPPMFIESFMLLGAVTNHIMSSQKIQKLMVTSALEGEGKTMTSVNLAMSLANCGKTVLLIDCDLRKPSIHKLMGIDKGEVSDLYGVFECEKDIKECIKEIFPGFFVIPFINHIDKRQVLFRSKNFIRIIDTLAKYYDYIIFDTAPVYDVNDSLNLVDLVDGVLLVVRQEKASVKVIKKVVDNLNRVEATIIGCVLNDVKYIKESTKYSKKYNYHYNFKINKKNDAVIIPYTGSKSTERHHTNQKFSSDKTNQKVVNPGV